MKIKIEIINGEEYEIKMLDSGYVVKELKMTEAQRALMAIQAEPVKPLEEKVDEILKKKGLDL